MENQVNVDSSLKNNRKEKASLNQKIKNDPKPCFDIHKDNNNKENSGEENQCEVYSHESKSSVGQ